MFSCLSPIIELFAEILCKIDLLLFVSYVSISSYGDILDIYPFLMNPRISLFRLF